MRRAQPRDDAEFAHRYRAVSARDRRFDGQFVTAVTSTGVYCRPSCPARTPRPENVMFFLTSAAAQEAGFRACKRCRPEAVPGSPDWDARADLVGRAMRLIADAVVDREGVEGLAARLGYSSRHIARLLRAELGAGPLALARARRAQLARDILVSTRLPVADVAFAAGFGSVRQLNDTVREVFATSPAALRADGAAPGRRAREQHRPCPEPQEGPAPRTTPQRARTRASHRVHVELALPVRSPFDAEGVFSFLASRAIPGAEAVDLGAAGDDGTGGASGARQHDERRILRYARSMRLERGPAAFEVLAVRDGDDWDLRLGLELTDLSDTAVAVNRVRRLLDLDANPGAVDEALAQDPHLAPLVAGQPGIRVPGCVDAPEIALRAVVGQRISVAAARTHLTRLADACGEPYHSSFAGVSRLLPTPPQILEALADQRQPGEQGGSGPLRLPRRHLQAVIDLVRDLAQGDLALDVGQDTPALRAALTARAGLGDWTASYVAMRVLGDPDVWLIRDAALLAGARRIGLVDAREPAARAHRALGQCAQRWAPWRSYAVMHLWRAAARRDA